MQPTGSVVVAIGRKRTDDNVSPYSARNGGERHDDDGRYNHTARGAGRPQRRRTKKCAQAALLGWRRIVTSAGASRFGGRFAQSISGGFKAGEFFGARS